MSNGADNFYKSDKVTVQKVTFKNQYQMNVAGNLFVPKDLNRDAKHRRDRRRAPDGRGEGAEREPLRHEDGRAGASSPCPWTCPSGARARASRATPSRRTSTPRTSAPRWTSWAPGRSSTGSGSARIGICGSGSFVISAAKIDPRMKAIATVSMYDMGAANRNALKQSADPRAAQEDPRGGRASSAYVEFAGGETKYTERDGARADRRTSHPIQREFYDFYRTPRGEFTPKGSSPELTTHPTLTQQRASS